VHRKEYKEAIIREGLKNPKKLAADWNVKDAGIEV
jgi:hypothetical protein